MNIIPFQKRIKKHVIMRICFERFIKLFSNNNTSVIYLFILNTIFINNKTITFMRRKITFSKSNGSGLNIHMIYLLVYLELLLFSNKPSFLLNGLIVICLFLCK